MIWLWCIHKHENPGPAGGYQRRASTTPHPPTNAVRAGSATALQALLAPARFPAVAAPLSEPAKRSIENIFAFAYIWALGGALDMPSRDAFDGFVRQQFLGIVNFPLGAGLVYDYFCDPDR